jgi:hypothetical protein
MYIVRETQPGVFVELPPGQSIVAGGISHPWQAAELWSDTELAAIGVYRVTPAVVPAGERAIGYTFERDGGGILRHVMFTELLPVTPRQARLALLQAGKLGQVNQAINQLDEATKVTWEYATEINRTDPLIVSLGASLGMTPLEIDNLFALARTL